MYRAVCTYLRFYLLPTVFLYIFPSLSSSIRPFFLQFAIILGPAVAQAVSRRYPSADARVRAQGSLVEYVVDNAALGQVSLWFLRVLLSISFHRCSIFTHLSTGDWTLGPLVAAVPQRASPLRNINKPVFCILSAVLLRPNSFTFVKGIFLYRKSGSKINLDLRIYSEQ
jgi:hypothetical protein